MSVYNGEGYLREAVDSILAQTMPDFEFVAVNDGSTDCSTEILDSYSDPRLRVVHQENVGLAAALNRGLKMARAEIVARMDADDIALPDRLEAQLAEYERLGKPDVLGGHVEYISENGHSLGSRQQPVEHADIVERLVKRRGGTPIIHPTVFLKRASVLRHGGYDPSFRYNSQDYDLWLRMSRDCRFANIRHIVLKLRLNTNSTQSRITKTSFPSRTSNSWWICVAQQRYFLEKEGAGNLWDDPETRERIFDLLWPRFMESGFHKVSMINRTLALIRADMKTPGCRTCGIRNGIGLCFSHPIATGHYLIVRRLPEVAFLKASDIVIKR